jgi:uncharacterized protein
MSTKVVADTSPLIGLQRIGRLDVLRDLFGEVNVPPAVMREFAHRASPPPWLIVQRLPDPNDPSVHDAPLGIGEREAIALGLQVGVDWLILDDEAGRRPATSRGLPIIGTIGVLILAKERGIVEVIRPLVEALVAVNFRLAPHLIRRVLSAAGEGARDS